MRGSRSWTDALLLLLGVALSVLAVPVAQATPPGRNGAIAYVDSGAGIGAIHPGTGRTAQIRCGQAFDPAGSIPLSDETEPAWSPDGTRIAFSARAVRVGASRAEIWSVGAAGGDRAQVTGAPEAGAFMTFHEAPDWSPDGQRIAFPGRVENAGDHGTDTIAETSWAPTAGRPSTSAGAASRAPPSAR